jgi:HD-like signal output (HDOD) protein
MVKAHLRDPGPKDQESYWSLKGLPPFPAVVTRLMNLLATEDYEMHQLVELIRADPMFASELLLATNSAKYGLGKEVTSLRHAAALLGRETLRSFAVAVSLRMYIGRVARQDLLTKIWRHSLATAVICDLIAECNPEGRRSSRDDTPYVAGLLHDIGCLGLMVTHPKEYADALGAALSGPRDLREVEQEMFRIDHCAAGQRIACAWKFSPAIGEVALRHHQPPVAGDFTLVEIVKVAVLMADALAFEVVPAPQPMTLPQAAAFLPAAVRVRFHKHIDVLPDRVAERIRSFEL